VSCVRLVRERARARGASTWETVQAVNDHCGTGLLRAYRFVHRWTLAEVVERLRELLSAAGQPYEGLKHQRLSRWELGAEQPSPRYLDALCQLYRTRSDRLGFGRDYSEPETAAAPATVDDGGRPAGREQLRHLPSALSGPAGPAPLFDALGSVRTRTDALLESQLISTAGVDTWEEVADNYGRLQLTTPALTLLAQVAGDVTELRGILAHRQTVEVQRRLSRVLAQLAGLIAITVNHVSDSRESAAWLHTARLAADETGDRVLRAWVTAHQSMLYLWYERPAERAVELSRRAQAIAGSEPSAPAALALAMEARAQARLERRREAFAAIRQAEMMFKRLSPADTRSTILGFDPHRMHWYLQDALTRLRQTTAAMAMQREARQLSAVDLALVQLDRATCLLHAGHVEQACRVANQAFSGLPVASRAGLVRYRANAVAAMAAARAPGLAPVRALRETIRNEGS
jgi:transcriptional regulator with XRE-family HTH domain